MIHRFFGELLLAFLAKEICSTSMLVDAKTRLNASTNGERVYNVSPTETEEDMEEESEELPLTSKVVYGVVIPAMAVVCIIGNILTILSFVQDRKLQTVHNTYLMSLAVSDLLIGCISMPFYAVYTLMDDTWPFGVEFCKIFMCIDFLACLDSVFTIMLVSYDRCMLLLQGASYSIKQTSRAAKIRIMISWFIAFLMYVPAIVFWDVVRGYSVVEEEDCDVEFYDDFIFIMATSVVEFLIPLATITSLNIFLYTLILKRAREAPGNKMADKLGKLDGDKDKRNMIKRERKAARSLAILVSVFTVCWMPYTVCTVIVAFCDGCVPADLYEAFNWLLWGNSTLNPFLYAFTSNQFQINFIRLLGLKKLCFSSKRVAPKEMKSDSLPD
ncbi:histamine H3 receptor-like [Liolophura sinensis]|uniref:histamine H3 receptor-like n=1 Tax=Liolophura sinensis TaxID=3198878 RepID=UPI0031595A51